MVDVELSNAIESGTFGEGLLTTLNMRIPPGFRIDEPVTICIEPDFIADGFEMVPAQAGDPLEVVIMLAGDFDADMDVDIDDLVEVIVNWGPCPKPPPAPPRSSCSGDANGDGQVDVNDLALVILNWTS